MTSFPQIVVGTYEHFVLGYKVEINDTGDFRLVQNFATKTHHASIRSIATYGKLLASASADESINIYDMIQMKVSHVVNYHASTVTSLEFATDGSHLITGNQNGSIVTFRCLDWKPIKVWKEAHKGGNGVIETSIHPSGGLMQSIGSDNILRFWNLVKGRLAYAVNMGKKITPGNDLNHVKWSKCGEYYVVCIGKFAEVYDVDTAAVIYELTCENKISSVNFTENNTLCIGTEDGTIELHRIESKKIIYKEKCHETRIKCLQSFTVQNPDAEKAQKFILSADSGGVIKLQRIKKKKENYSVKLKCSADTGCRITCLSIVSIDVKKETEKNKHKESGVGKPIELNESQNISDISQDLSVESKKPKKKKSFSESWKQESLSNSSSPGKLNVSKNSKKKGRNSGSVLEMSTSSTKSQSVSPKKKDDSVSKNSSPKIKAQNLKKRKRSFNAEEIETFQQNKKSRADVDKNESVKKFRKININNRKRNRNRNNLISRKNKGAGKWLVEGIA